jgi:hypothetical protein
MRACKSLGIAFCFSTKFRVVVSDLRAVSEFASCGEDKFSVRRLFVLREGVSAGWSFKGWMTFPERVTVQVLSV